VKLRLLLLPCCAALALSVGLATATGGNGGNSANAKLCQKGGWQTLYRSDGSSFVSEEACVSYAAEGGTLSAIPPVFQQAASHCTAAGGTFTIGNGAAWTCGPLPFDQTLSSTLAGDCNAYRQSLTPPRIPVPGIYNGNNGLYVCTTT
jgi:hypothetical protein